MVVFLHNKMLHSNEDERNTAAINSSSESLKYNFKQNKPHTIYTYSIYITCTNKQN